MKKRNNILRVLILSFAFLGIGLFSVGYAKFVTKHRTSVIIGCTIMIILIMGLQCYLKIRQFKNEKKRETDFSQCERKKDHPIV